MGRIVTCQICKTKGNSDVLHRVTDENGKNKYYCNKEEYEKREYEKRMRYDLLKYVAEEVLQYEEKQIVPPSMVKRIEKLNEFYNYDVIKEVFHLNKETIQYWIKTKNFTSEYGMASYIMTIIEGNINDVYKTWKYQQDQRVKMENTTIDVSLFNDINASTIGGNEYIIGIDYDVKKPIKQNRKDISIFLDEEDM